MRRTGGAIRVAVVGLKFGGAFPPIYLDHPDVAHVGICDLDAKLLQAYGDKFGIERRHHDIDEILASPDYDAVHLLTPIHSHAGLTLSVLNAGMHCACTVPMGTTLDELKAIVATQKRTGRIYMMMETAVYTYQYLYAQKMLATGEFGQLQFLRGAHYQDMEDWPPYWQGLPPMHYATHAVAPLLALSGSRAVKVHCYGSGTMRAELRRRYGNPFPVETAIFQLERENLCAEVTRTLFHTARDYMESFNVYGEKRSFEWHMEKEPPVVFEMQEKTNAWGRGRLIDYGRVTLPDFQELLPTEIAHHSVNRIVFDPDHPDLSVKQGGAHHGSHPHLVHEFIRSIVENRTPRIGAVTAADWTAAGICAHASAMRDGAEVIIPGFA